MTEKQWRESLGELVRDYIRSPELEYYFSIKMSKPRAAVMVKQQSLFVRHRRDCWAHVSANCPVLGVKQRILEHEYEEIIRDDFSEYGHLHLIIRQGKSVGLEPEEIINAEPLPETLTTLYAAKPTRSTVICFCPFSPSMQRAEKKRGRYKPRRIRWRSMPCTAKG
jgi:pyrroloquinoline quinone (PQQ) biosynthesis protein C